jgi:hypothetical protein
MAAAQGIRTEIWVWMRDPAEADPPVLSPSGTVSTPGIPPVPPPGHALIRPQNEPGVLLTVPKRSPYRAPFKTKPKSAVFWQSDKIKQSHKHVYLPVFVPGRVLDHPGKRSCFKRVYGPNNRIVWGSILAYFGKPDVIRARIRGVMG